jgi:hypothetical protein
MTATFATNTISKNFRHSTQVTLKTKLLDGSTSSWFSLTQCKCDVIFLSKSLGLKFTSLHSTSIWTWWATTGSWILLYLLFRKCLYFSFRSIIFLHSSSVSYNHKFNLSFYSDNRHNNCILSCSRVLGGYNFPLKRGIVKAVILVCNNIKGKPN